MIVEPKLLSETEIMEAVEDPADPIYREIARLVTASCENLGALSEELGFFPRGLLHGSPEEGIEKVALRLTMRGFDDTIAHYSRKQELARPCAAHRSAPEWNA